MSTSDKKSAGPSNINHPHIEDTDFRSQGPADNQNFFDITLKKSPLFSGFMFMNCNASPFTESWDDSLIPAMMAIGNVGRARVLGQQRIDFDSVYTCVCAEMLGPVLPNSIFLAQTEAQKLIGRSVKTLLLAEDCENYTSFTMEKYNELRTEKPEYPVIDATNYPTITIALLILRLMAQNATTLYQVGPLGILVHTCISIIKRGTVSVAFTDKIRSGIVTDLGSCPPLRSNVLQMFYTRFGLYINDTNVSEIFDRWILQIGEKALRLTLTIQQASGSGITSYLTILEAMTKYPDFDWHIVYSKFPAEWNNFSHAVDIVGNNKYFGYRKDLGPAKSTLFKSISYVAKEILIKIDGKSSLRAYGGWANRIPYKAEMDLLISEYEEKLKSDMTAEQIEQAQDTVQTLILKLNNLDL